MTRRRGKGIVIRGETYSHVSLSLLTCLLPVPLTIFNIFDGYVLFPPSLQGLRLLQGTSEKREEARKLEVEAEKMEAEGWGKLREAVTGSEAEGLYGLLRGVTSSSHHLLSRPLPCQSCISPGPSASPQPPQESTEPKT